MVFLRRCKIRQIFFTKNYSHIPSHSLDGPYDPTLIEQDWYKWWQENGFFSPKHPFNECSSCNRVVTILPPPNITGILHLGHALTISIQDALIRWERMRGKSVIWIPGTDHAGIATQSIMEQFLMKTQKLKRKDMTRSMFEDIIWKWKGLNVAYIYNQIAFMGASLDWSKEFFTLDSSLSKVVTNCFIQLFNEGLIYRDMKMVNWSCSLETVISDIEVDHKVINKPTEIMIRGEPIEFGVLHKIAYPLVDPCNITEVVVSTSRVETIPGDRAISVNPNDIRFLNLHGKYCYHPLDPHIKIPIIPDEMVDPNFGTGAVKITPAHDPNDYMFSVRHKIPVVNVFDFDGRMNASCLLPELQHIDRLKCRKYILSKLKDKGLYRGSQNYQTSISFCSRSGDIIEYFLKSQWYLKTRSLASKVYDNMAGKFSVLPQHYSNKWIKWLENIEDWCISRQLWWGHRIPAWYVDCENGYWIAAESEQAALKISGGKDVKQDLDVLDTWFSSALLPLSVFRWDNKNIPIEYPLTFIESGSDLLFFWILRMALLCTHFTGKFPFNEIILHPLIRDSQGRKMSKSLGNIIDPLQIIKGVSLEISEDNAFNGNDLEQDMKHHLKTAKQQFSNGVKAMGTDSLRFSLIDYTKQTHQINMDIANVSSAKYIFSKLWNATKFFLCQIKYYNLKIIDENFKSEHIFDKYIISRLKETINLCNMGFELRRLFDVTKCLRRFIVYDLCSVYLEFIKQELKQNDNKRAECALSILYSTLYTVVKLLHPIAPFITEELYQKLLVFDPYSKISIMISNYPHKNGSFYLDYDSIKRIENIMMLVHEFRSMISNVGRLNYEHEGIIEINDRNKIFKEDVVKFKNIIRNMIGMKSLSLNDLNSGLLNVHSKFVNSELVLHLRVEKLCLNSFKQMNRIKWLQKQEEIISRRLKSEKYVQNASKCVQVKDIERLMDIQNELKLVRNLQKNAI
ncbi:valine-tRNA ligase [Pneumocystis murina B123]|uniref:valine--tRNA ligase n=1 Tax=Pneumocystis murina (strain B123) TaxID=1069680 RepID=M7NQ96_PNEMU|nr:valine-tRNA ligase [Pneumocystis murina B123]EMR09442.2 valine-tRNA ligase [Pneumocystis murina B123]